MARGSKLGDEGGSKEALTALLQARGAGGLVQSSKKGSSNGTAICAEAEWAGGLVQSSRKGKFQWNGDLCRGRMLNFQINWAVKIRGKNKNQGW